MTRPLRATDRDGAVMAIVAAIAAELEVITFPPESTTRTTGTVCRLTPGRTLPTG